MYKKRAQFSIFLAKKAHSGNYATRLEANCQPSEDIFNANQALLRQLLRQKVAMNSQIWSPYLGIGHRMSC